MLWDSYYGFKGIKGLAQIFFLCSFLLLVSVACPFPIAIGMFLVLVPCSFILFLNFVSSIMLKRNPPPGNILTGDLIVIEQEDELYKELIHSKFVVLEIDLTRADGRTIKPGQFNGKPVRPHSAPQEDYWTKVEFVEVEKRTVNGYDVYYETSLDKSMVGDGKRNWFFELLRAVFG